MNARILSESTNQLSRFRRNAADLSGGTSNDVIKNCVIRYLTSADATGSLLDFGAGQAELLIRLQGNGRFGTLAGMDILPRPSGLHDSIKWVQQDLNEPIEPIIKFDNIVCSETIEHLENPRHTFRCLAQLLKPNGLLILTMPNQESIRALLGLALRGHFTHFLGSCYPAHITALVRLDLVRMCEEVGLDHPRFLYTNDGGIPKVPHLSWQRASGGLLRGRLFSDNLIMISRAKTLPPVSVLH